MNRRSLALGAAIALPAGFAAFHADASAAPAPFRPRRGRRDPDKAIRDLHRAYFDALEAERRVSAEPHYKGGTPENERQEEVLADAVGRQCDAIEAAGTRQAATLEAVRLKAEIFNDAAKEVLAGAFEIEPDNRVLLLAASICTDLVRLIPSEGVQA
jgi:hypothetical protein